ncbi:hypothetical protein [Pseudomonas sp. VEM90]
MDTNKMREQFEAAFVEEEVRLLGEGFRSSALHMVEQNTVNVRSAWWAWQASREAVVVELPNRAAEAYREEFDDVEGGSFNEAAYIRDVRKAIEDRGLKVAS